MPELLPDRSKEMQGFESMLVLSQDENNRPNLIIIKPKQDPENDWYPDFNSMRAYDTLGDSLISGLEPGIVSGNLSSYNYQTIHSDYGKPMSVLARKTGVDKDFADYLLNSFSNTILDMIERGEDISNYLKHLENGKEKQLELSEDLVLIDYKYDDSGRPSSITLFQSPKEGEIINALFGPESLIHSGTIKYKYDESGRIIQKIKEEFDEYSGTVIVNSVSFYEYKQLDNGFIDKTEAVYYRNGDKDFQKFLNISIYKKLIIDPQTNTIIHSCNYRPYYENEAQGKLDNDSLLRKYPYKITYTIWKEVVKSPELFADSVELVTAIRSSKLEEFPITRIEDMQKIPLLDHSNANILFLNEYLDILLESELKVGNVNKVIVDVVTGAYQFNRILPETRLEAIKKLSPKIAQLELDGRIAFALQVLPSMAVQSHLRLSTEEQVMSHINMYFDIFKVSISDVIKLSKKLEDDNSLPKEERLRVAAILRDIEYFAKDVRDRSHLFKGLI